MQYQSVIVINLLQLSVVLTLVCGHLILLIENQKNMKYVFGRVCRLREIASKMNNDTAFVVIAQQNSIIFQLSI